MSADRFALRLALFAKAVDSLALALQQPEDEFVRDSVIKRFELAFETARKALRQWLEDQQELAPGATKKQVMEAAHQLGLLGDSEAWNAIVAQRNDVSHEYDANKAVEAAAFARAVAYPAFRALLAELQARA